jgi:very-short-patch-repair endonuclease
MRIRILSGKKRLEELGIRFLRFDDIDVKQDMTFVLNRIHDWIIEKTHP